MESIESLRKMSDDALHAKMLLLALEEQKHANFILIHLKEVDRRKLWAKLGFSSLYDYCRKALHYCESESYRKMAAVQIAEEIPEIQDRIENKDLHLTTVAKAQAFFKRAAKLRKISVEEKKKILTSLEKKTQREVDRELAILLPKAAKPDRVRAISQDQVQVSHVADQSLLEKLKRLRELLAHSVSRDCDQNELLHKICDIALAQVNPLVKARNKEICSKSRQKFSSMRVFPPQPGSPSIEASRYIPAKLRREIWLRDQGACTFIHPATREKCQSRFAIQIDHIVPFAKGGRTNAENLRLLCRTHNRYAAIREFGMSKIYSPRHQ